MSGKNNKDVFSLRDKKSMKLWRGDLFQAIGQKRSMSDMLLEYLKPGKDNAVSLESLVRMSGLGKRQVRNEISKINTSGEEIICTDADGTGYYIAATFEEAKAYLKYNRSYLQSSIEKDKGIRKCMERKFSGQMVLAITPPGIIGEREARMKAEKEIPGQMKISDWKK